MMGVTTKHSVAVMALLLCVAGTVSAGGQCETAWAQGSPSKCFTGLGGVTRWGWTNKVEQGSSQVLKVWAGAGLCDTSKGTYVGNAFVSFSSTRKVRVNVVMLEGWAASDGSMHIGEAYLHVKRGEFTAAPGQFPHQATGPSISFEVPVDSAAVYIALHINACPSGATATPATPAPATPVPPPPAPECVGAAQTEGSVEQVWAGEVAGESTVVPVAGVAAAEGMAAWTVGGATPTLHDLPPVLVQDRTMAFFPQQNTALPAGNAHTLRVHCPDSCERTSCEVVVVTYHCPPASTNFNGGFPTVLPLDGWAAGRCAPAFQYAADKPKHNMVAFRKLIPAGSTETLPHTTTRLSNFAVFVRTGAADCNDFLTDKAQCVSAPACRWAAGECVSNWCPPAPQGTGTVGAATVSLSSSGNAHNPCMPGAPTGA